MDRGRGIIYIVAEDDTEEDLESAEDVSCVDADAEEDIYSDELIVDVEDERSTAFDETEAFLQAAASNETSGTCGDNLTWTLSFAGTLTISGTGDMDNYLYYDSPFCKRSDIVSVVIKNGVKSIGDAAFESCTKLTSLVIPGSVISIGTDAFWECSSLKSIIIPNSVTSIGYAAFHGCSSLASVTIPSSMTKMEGALFWECSSLKSITIPDGVTNIGIDDFRGCSSLKNIEIPESVTSIEAYAFYECSSLSRIVIPESVTKIESRVFRGCDHLEEITLGSKVKTIEGEAFRDCVSLQQITLPNSITTIGNAAFCGCNSLTDISIPVGVKNIGAYLFSECGSLTSVGIPNSVTSIWEYAFYGCNSLASILLPDQVKYIENNAFDGCSSLISLTIPDGVTRIGEGAFANTNLKRINLPVSLEEDNKIFCDINQQIYYPPAEIIIPAGFTTVFTLPRTYWDETGNKYDSAPLNLPTEIVLKLTHTHIWDSGKVTKAATTTAAGIKTFTCTDCGETKTESIAKLKPKKPVEKITITKKPTIQKLSATKNKITVKWKHFKHTTKKAKKLWKPIKGVQIQCATDSGFKNIVKTTTAKKSKTSVKIKGLKKTTTYYVRVRYFDGKGYLAWSKVKKVKTK